MLAYFFLLLVTTVVGVLGSFVVLSRDMWRTGHQDYFASLYDDLMAMVILRLMPAFVIVTYLVGISLKLLFCRCYYGRRISKKLAKDAFYHGRIGSIVNLLFSRHKEVPRDSCFICKMPLALSNPKKLAQLNCPSCIKVHQQCLKRWLTENESCPHCAFEFKSEMKVYA